MTGSQRWYDDDVLSNDYLVTTSCTAFHVPYLYELTLSTFLYNASISSIATLYNYLHFSCLSEDLACKREEVYEKRLSHAYFLYIFLELCQVGLNKTLILKYNSILQRCGLKSLVNFKIDDTIKEKYSELEKNFRINWSKHVCKVYGCVSTLIGDGGMKPHRKVKFILYLIHN